MTREERKKLLIVEGLMHRLEIAHALHQLRSEAQADRLLGRLPEMLGYVMTRRHLVPLIAAAAPLVFGKSSVSRLLRRVLMVAGVGTALAALLRRWRAARGD